MFQKRNLLQLGFLMFLITIIYSCNKQKSSDSPLAPIYSTTVVVPTDNGTIYGINAETGAKNWEYKSSANDLSDVKDTAYTYPIITAWDSIGCYIKGGGSKSDQSELMFFNTKTGKDMWYSSNFYRYSNLTFYNNYLYAITKQTTDTILRKERYGNTVWYASPLNSDMLLTAPTIVGNYLYILGYGTTTNQIYCFNVTAPSFSPPVWVSSPVINSLKKIAYSNGNLYISGGKKVQKINATTGSIVWTFSGAINNIATTPIVYGDMVVVGSDDYTEYCIDAISGKTIARWTFATNDMIKSSACLDKANHSFIFGSNDNNLYSVNHINGTLNWKFPTGSFITSSPVYYNGNIIFVSNDQYCYSVNSTSGALNWKFRINSTSNVSPMICTFGSGEYYSTDCSNEVH